MLIGDFVFCTARALDHRPPLRFLCSTATVIGSVVLRHDNIMHIMVCLCILYDQFCENHACSH